MTSKTYLHGKLIDDAVEVHEHISPQSSYIKVLAALFVLTGLTYAVSYANLGAASLYVAMGVAFVKAGLVAAFFMHLRYDDRFHVFAFLSTMIFVAIFFTFTIFDLNSRTRLNEEQGTLFRVEQGGDWNDAQVTNKAAVRGPAEVKGPATGDGKAAPAAATGDGKAAPAAATGDG
ncbi:MAG: cytochrome C oxidase subunit IV family protein, partial [Deltaproteobacteria bacterium]|nr:cytochrome C oxidase subunit IV family protein [Nannocystaceae bacterium]